MTDKITRLKEQKKALENRIRLEEAKAKKKARAEETRKKILLGALAMEWMKTDAGFKARIEKALPSFLTRENDRRLFGLAPAPDVNTDDTLQEAAGG